MKSFLKFFAITIFCFYKSYGQDRGLAGGSESVTSKNTSAHQLKIYFDAGDDKNTFELAKQIIEIEKDTTCALAYNISLLLLYDKVANNKMTIAEEEKIFEYTKKYIKLEPNDKNNLLWAAMACENAFKVFELNQDLNKDIVLKKDFYTQIRPLIPYYENFLIQKRGLNQINKKWLIGFYQLLKEDSEVKRIQGL